MSSFQLSRFGWNSFTIIMRFLNEFHPNLEKTTSSVLSVILINLWMNRISILLWIFPRLFLTFLVYCIVYFSLLPWWLFITFLLYCIFYFSLLSWCTAFFTFYTSLVYCIIYFSLLSWCTAVFTFHYFPGVLHNLLFITFLVYCIIYFSLLSWCTA